MTLITALPFSVIMVLFMVSLLKGLTIDQAYYDRNFSKSTVPWSGRLWKDRLKQIVATKNRSSVELFINNVVKVAFVELQEEFDKNDINTHINYKKNPSKIEIEIKYDVINNFVYGVEIASKKVSNYLIDEDNLPEILSESLFW